VWRVFRERKYAEGNKGQRPTELRRRSLQKGNVIIRKGLSSGSAEKGGVLGAKRRGKILAQVAKKNPGFSPCELIFWERLDE